MASGFQTASVSLLEAKPQSIPALPFLTQFPAILKQFDFANSAKCLMCSARFFSMRLLFASAAFAICQ